MNHSDRRASELGELRAGLYLGAFGVGLWCLVVLLAVALAGCSSVLKDLPAGSNVQVSTTGVRLSPQAIDGPLILGQSTYILQTPTPTDAGPGLNRSEVQAGLSGVKIKSTVATGTVGEQIEAAGGAEALRVLLPDSGGGLPDSGFVGPVLAE